MLAPRSSLTTSDVEVVSELVNDVDFEATDLIQVIDAIGVVAKSLKRRRSAQRMHPQIIHYFTAAEWRAMNGGGGIRQQLEGCSRSSSLECEMIRVQPVRTT